MVKIGVLGLQGTVREHAISIESCGEEAIIIKKREQLDEIDGLILPGGESTTMLRLLNCYGFLDKLQHFDKPIFGTCAGLILLAKKIKGYYQPNLGIMDVVVERNSFSRQKESFETELAIIGVADCFNAVFIRAPHILEVGEDVEILAKYDGRIVAARDGKILGCSFHPELTEDHRLTQYFIGMVKETKNINK